MRALPCAKHKNNPAGGMPSRMTPRAQREVRKVRGASGEMAVQAAGARAAIPTARHCPATRNTTHTLSTNPTNK